MARPRHSLLSILLLIAEQLIPTHCSAVERQSSPNPYISSGTCYTGQGVLADSSYIPCGNTAFGNFACCEAGSVCLQDNACFSYLGSGPDEQITYVAGCTDPNYADASCPPKGQQSSNEWAGLVYCGGTSDEWTLCPADTVQVAVAAGCVCPSDPSSRDIAFNAPSTISSILTLPATNGGSLTSINGNYALNTVPTSTSQTTTTTTTTTTKRTTTTTTTPSAAKTSSSAAASSTAKPASSSSPSAQASSTSPSTSTSTVTSTTSASHSGTALASSSSLSTGAKAGIGAGAAVGGILLVALLILLALWYRRRNRRRNQTGGGGLGGNRPTAEISSMAPMATTTTTPYHDHDTHYAGAAVGAGMLLPHDQQQQQYEQQQRQQQQQQMDAQRGASPAWSSTDNRSELPTGSERYSGAAQSTSSPHSVQQSWSRPMSEADGTSAGGYGAGYNTYQSMSSKPSQELSGVSAVGRGRGEAPQAYQSYRRPDVGVRRVPVGGSSTSGSSYQPGRNVGDGVYEMPANLPGSTMM